MHLVAELTVDDLNAVLFALQELAANASGAVTPSGILHYGALHDRLARLPALDVGEQPHAANDALWGAPCLP